MCLKKRARLSIVSRLSNCQAFLFLFRPPFPLPPRGRYRSRWRNGRCSAGAGLCKSCRSCRSAPAPRTHRRLSERWEGGAASAALSPLPPAPKFGQPGPAAPPAVAARPAAGRRGRQDARPPRRLSRCLPALTFHLTFILRYNFFVLFESARG